MKFHIQRVVALLAAVGSVESVLTLPSCSNSCLTDYTGATTDTVCNMFDYKCICTNKVVLQAAVCCLYEHCSDSDREQAEEYSKTICNELGYIIPSGLTACSSATASAGDSSKTVVAVATNTADNAAASTIDVVASSSAGDSGYTLPTSDSSSDSGSGSDSSSSKSSASKLHPKKSKTGLGVGLGVGLPLLAAAAGYLAFFLRKRKQASAAAAAAATEPEQQQPVTQVPPAGGYQAPPPQGYMPPGYPQGQAPPSYPQQGYPPQAYPPQSYPVAGGIVDPYKVVEPSVSPVSNSITPPNTNTTGSHEMLANMPPPRQELSPVSHVAHSELSSTPAPPPPAAMMQNQYHAELPINHPPTHQELP